MNERASEMWILSIPRRRPPQRPMRKICAKRSRKGLSSQDTLTASEVGIRPRHSQLNQDKKSVSKPHEDISLLLLLLLLLTSRSMELSYTRNLGVALVALLGVVANAEINQINNVSLNDPSRYDLCAVTIIPIATAAAAATHHSTHTLRLQSSRNASTILHSTATRVVRGSTITAMAVPSAGATQYAITLTCLGAIRHAIPRSDRTSELPRPLTHSLTHPLIDYSSTAFLLLCMRGGFAM